MQPLRTHCLRLLGLILVLFMQALSAQEASQPVSVSAVKAAYLVNFAKFTTWESLDLMPESPIVIGVVADRELEEVIFKLAAGQKISGHPLRVRRIVKDDELLNCHLVYFGDQPRDEIRRMLGVLGPASVLTVSSAPGFLDLGGMIAFYSEDRYLRFEIAAEKTAESGLVLSSRLLALSRPNPGRKP